MKKIHSNVKKNVRNFDDIIIGFNIRKADI